MKICYKIYFDEIDQESIKTYLLEKNYSEIIKKFFWGEYTIINNHESYTFNAPLLFFLESALGGLYVLRNRYVSNEIRGVGVWVETGEYHFDVMKKDDVFFFKELHQKFEFNNTYDCLIKMFVHLRSDIIDDINEGIYWLDFDQIFPLPKWLNFH